MNPPSTAQAATTDLPDWRALVENSSVQVEPGVDSRSVALWVPGSQDAHYRYWQRVSPVPHTDFAVEPGIYAVAAVSISARQPLTRLLQRLRLRFQTSAPGRIWPLPHGASAEQCGEPRSDLLLVWSDGPAGGLDAAWLQKRWPRCPAPDRLGPGLYLLVGVPLPPSSFDSAPEEGCPTRRAERLLTAARQAGDRHRTVTALTDLGIIRLNKGDSCGAIALLEEALQLARALGDSSQIGDVAGNLGLALLVAGQLQRAQALFDPAPHRRALPAVRLLHQRQSPDDTRSLPDPEMVTGSGPISEMRTQTTRCSGCKKGSIGARWKARKAERTNSGFARYAITRSLEHIPCFAGS